MAPLKKHVVFDVVGTLVSYDRVFTAIDTRLGEKLRSEGIKPTLFGYAWMEVAEREYTYLSISDKYTPFGTCFEALFYRMLAMSGIAEPHKFASDSDLEYIMSEYQYLEMRPGAAECISKLRDAGFTVWAFTAGDLRRVGGYFAHANIEMPAENLLSCDSTGVGKPAIAAYKPLLEQLKKDGEVWFAAAHLWDVSAAGRAGYKTAYSLVWEKEALPQLFGEMDVTAQTLPEMADGIIAASGCNL